MGRLDGRVAIVTGGGQGTGRGIAMALVKEGASAVIAGRTLRKCVRTAEEIAAIGGRALPVAFVAGIREQAEALVATTVKEFGAIDILVNSAQDARPGVPLEETTDENMALTLESGLWGTFHLMRACFPYLKEHGGKIINLASGAGIEGLAGFGAYAAAKEGIRGLSRVAAREWARYGITVNVICPFANAPGQQLYIRAHPEEMARNIALVPMGRIGDCEADIGRAAVFVASSDADFITGQTLMVDGGRCMYP